MTLHRVELRLAVTLDNATGFRKWRTTFYADTATPLAAANQVRQDWIDQLRDTCRDKIYAYAVYAVDLNPATSAFALISIGDADQRGSIATPDELYPIEQCLAVGIEVPSSRPSRKFWRAGYCESDYTQGVFSNSTFATIIRQGFDNIAQSGNYRDVDGQEWVAVLQAKQSIRRLGRTAGFDVPTPPAVG